MLTERSFDTGELVLNVAESKAAGSPLVMPHGSTLHWQSFGALILTLEQRWHIYACDLRGHGKSGRAKAGYLYDGYGFRNCHRAAMAGVPTQRSSEMAVATGFGRRQGRCRWQGGQGITQLLCPAGKVFDLALLARAPMSCPTCGRLCRVATRRYRVLTNKPQSSDWRACQSGLKFELGKGSSRSES
jgi:hypothetical protein